jgi:hypothetical protein
MSQWVEPRACTNIPHSMASPSFFSVRFFVDELAALVAPSPLMLPLLLLLLLVVLVGAAAAVDVELAESCFISFFNAGPWAADRPPPFAAAAVAVLVLVLHLRDFATAVSIDWVHSSWGCGDCDCDPTVNGRTMLAPGCC